MLPSSKDAMHLNLSLNLYLLSSEMDVDHQSSAKMTATIEIVTPSTKNPIDHTDPTDPMDLTDHTDQTDHVDQMKDTPIMDVLKDQTMEMLAQKELVHTMEFVQMLEVEVTMVSSIV